MKIHLARVINPNRFGGISTTTLCGRANAACMDGMNSTDKQEEVTCSFCLRIIKMRKEGARK